MKDLGIIRRMFYRDGKSLSEIERRTGLTRKTIRLWLKPAPRRMSACHAGQTPVPRSAPDTRADQGSEPTSMLCDGGTFCSRS